jgi:hypothetical protein
MKFNSEWAKQYVDTELRFYGISVRKWRKGDCGVAFIKERIVEIPEPTTLNRFLICLHEITHIARAEVHKGMKVYEYEYDCEMTVINKAKQLGFDTTDYEHRAKGYITYCFAKAFNRNLNLEKANREVTDWLGINLKKWDKYDRAFLTAKNNWKEWSVKLVRFD